MSKDWSGEERRSNAQLSEQRLQTLERSFGVFGERLDNLIKSSDKMGDGVSDILKKISSLPCDKRQGWYDSIGIQMKAVWLILISVTLVLLNKLFAH